MTGARARKSSGAVFERVFEAFMLSLPDVDKLLSVLIDAVACLLWSERWKEHRSSRIDRDAMWKLWKKQDEDVRGCWHEVARRALFLIFGLKVSGKVETAKQLWARRLGSL